MSHISSSRRRYLSVWLRRLPTDRMMRSSPNLADAPLATLTSLNQLWRESARRPISAAPQGRTCYAPRSWPPCHFCNEPQHGNVHFYVSTTLVPHDTTERLSFTYDICVFE